MAVAFIASVPAQGAVFLLFLPYRNLWPDSTEKDSPEHPHRIILIIFMVVAVVLIPPLAVCQEFTNAPRAITAELPQKRGFQ